MSTDYIPFTVTDLDLTEEMQNELLENFKNGKELDQKKLEDLRKQLLNYVQPRLAWEVTLLEINFSN